ncbi:MAG: hypothetical protein A3F16_04480 [Deltaproteobacteria bacterium RIFCSPHIGHO2_12_FULL_43_9]|nr:MAG: hypothetical protein A3F16_04480 [Deltaproteobacteria bacterium RIFCSPHIGHO2_12_FULL_43_9]
MPQKGIRAFLKHFFRNPLSTGAITPSSRTLGRKMGELIEPERVKIVAEFGPGTGAITPFILKRLKPDSRFFAVERNKEFYEIFRSKYKNLTIFHDSIEQLSPILKKLNIDKIETIVSSLPWASFSDQLQEHFLRLIHKILIPGGTFLTFAYIHGTILPSGRNLRSLLDKTFSSVEVSPIIWRNIPPAIIYKCKK